MFGLGQQVSSDPGGARRIIGDDHRFGRSGQPVDTDHAVHLALGQGDEQVAGTKDFIYRADAAGAVRQRGDGLRAADGVHFLDSQQRGSGQDNGRNFPRRAVGWGDQDDL